MIDIGFLNGLNWYPILIMRCLIVQVSLKYCKYVVQGNVEALLLLMHCWYHSSVLHCCYHSSVLTFQMEDIKLPFKQGKMDDIGDEEVR